MAEKRSAKYETVKKYYDRGLWSEERVRQAAVKGWLTEKEAEEIVGK